MTLCRRLSLFMVLLPGLVLALASGMTVQQDAAPVDSPPNFVIILADDLGYGDLSCYGDYSRALTPHLDRMASEGLRFTDFHSSGNVCSPTRAGLLTGRYQQRAGIPGVINADPKVAEHFFGLGRNETTFAECLKQAGYQTGVFGKWHLGYDVYFNPLEHGFDEFRGYVSGNIDYTSHYDRMEKFDWWKGRALEDQRDPGPIGRVKNGYVTHLVTKNAIDFIERNKARPFCLYVAHQAVHSPWQGPLDAPIRGPNARKDLMADKNDTVVFAKMLEALDEGVGEILATIETCGIADRTMVLFFSDNGPAAGSAGPLRGRKGSNYEGGHRVPAIAWWPSRIEPRQQTDAQAISLDVMPTLLAIAGYDDQACLNLDGVDLSPVLFDRQSLGNRQLFWNGRAMRDGKWKLVLGKSNQGEVQLFDLSQDLGEKANVADQHPERARQMQKALEHWIIEVARGATAQPAQH